MKPLLWTMALAVGIAACLPTITTADYIPTSFTPVVHLTAQETIVKYAKVFATPEKELNIVAQCESGFNPKAWNKSDPNGGSKGIFQFQPQTFSHYAKVIGITTPDIWNSDQQIKVAAYMFSKGMQSQWSCSRLLKK